MTHRKLWKKKTQEEIKHRIFSALKENVYYKEEYILGVPGSHLDEKVFPQEDVPFIADAPFISTLVHNPNHIGCHTLGKSESFFSGTQEIERELIDICAVDILKGKSGQQDGYVASGGTEANLQAIWIYRNYFKQEFNASLEEICIITSEDNHYSMDKAANVLSIDVFKVDVVDHNREITHKSVQETLQKAINLGKKHFIVVVNMMTTMFGSVDSISCYIEELSKLNLSFKIHVDGAYGGFYYPFSNPNNILNFENSHIDSFTLDAHKMAQAPYGTGIFLIRKGLIQYANTKAGYVEGEDFTLIGSRSGANAIAVWMILMKHGPFGWEEKIFILQKRTQWLCDQLSQLNIEFYRHPDANIVTIRNSYVSETIAKKYWLVPDNHQNPNWFKIVVMDHVTIEKLVPLIEDLKSNLR
ncbi:tyrosine decarboxylase [Flavobacteriaceae bacterium UJ101]|nr:tyrosine decarboxylase [Flavobacteriaceae bacterium UJ101]